MSVNWRDGSRAVFHDALDGPGAAASAGPACPVDGHAERAPAVGLSAPVWQKLTWIVTTSAHTFGLEALHAFIPSFSGSSSSAVRGYSEIESCLFRLASYRNVREKSMVVQCCCQERLMRINCHSWLFTTAQMYRFLSHQTSAYSATQWEQEPCLLPILFVLMELRVPGAQREYCGQSCCTNDLSLAF